MKTTNSFPLRGSSETICKATQSLQNSKLLERLKKQYPEQFTYYQNNNHIYYIPFDWSNFQKKLPSHISKIDTQFLEWFLGFSEGDGSFIVDCNNRMYFTITQKDHQSLYKIKKTLGFGRVIIDNNYQGIARYTVSDNTSLERLIHLFNGNLLLEKTNHRFQRWVECYNKQNKTSISVVNRYSISLEKEKSFCYNKEMGENQSTNSSLPYYMQQHSVVWNSAWFSGFFDAEGCFSVNLRNSHHNKLVIKCDLRFLIDQKMEISLFFHLGLLLGDGSLMKRAKDIYRYETQSKKLFPLIHAYFHKFSLFTQKNLSYHRWCRIERIYAEIGRVYNENQYKRLETLVANINKDNEYFYYKQLCKQQQELS